MASLEILMSLGNTKSHLLAEIAAFDFSKWTDEMEATEFFSVTLAVARTVRHALGGCACIINTYSWMGADALLLTLFSY